MLDKYRNENQTKYPKYFIFLWIFQPLKINKDKIFKPKTLENLLLRHLKRWENLLLKFFIKTAQRDGYL